MTIVLRRHGPESVRKHRAIRNTPKLRAPVETNDFLGDIYICLQIQFLISSKIESSKFDGTVPESAASYRETIESPLRGLPSAPEDKWL